MSRVALSAILLLLLSLAAQAQPIGNLQRGAELATATMAPIVIRWRAMA